MKEIIKKRGVIAMALSKKTAYELAYQKRNVWQCKFNFNRATDADIIARLQSVPNRLGYIKTLIRADMERSDRHDDN